MTTTRSTIQSVCAIALAVMVTAGCGLLPGQRKAQMIDGMAAGFKQSAGDAVTTEQAKCWADFVGARLSTERLEQLSNNAGGKLPKLTAEEANSVVDGMTSCFSLTDFVSRTAFRFTKESQLDCVQQNLDPNEIAAYLKTKYQGKGDDPVFTAKARKAVATCSSA